MVMRPPVGSVMRLRIFSRVLFPAPFRPMMPTTSQRLTSKETSLSAQNSSEVGGRKAEGEGRKEEVEEAADAGLASQMIKASRMLEFCGEIVGMQIEDTDADGTEIIGKLPGIHAGHRGSLNEG